MTQEMQRRQSTEELVKGMEEHISAIQDALRQELTEREGQANSPTQLKMTLSVGKQTDQGDGDKAPPEARMETYCWTASYICGKGASGYIMCTRDICETTEVVLKG